MRQKGPKPFQHVPIDANIFVCGSLTAMSVLGLCRVCVRISLKIADIIDLIVGDSFEFRGHPELIFNCLMWPPAVLQADRYDSAVFKRRLQLSSCPL
jgi:hypothetical protein